MDGSFGAPASQTHAVNALAPTSTASSASEDHVEKLSEPRTVSPSKLTGLATGAEGVRRRDSSGSGKDDGDEPLGVQARAADEEAVYVLDAEQRL